MKKQQQCSHKQIRFALSLEDYRIPPLCYLTLTIMVLGQLPTVEKLPVGCLNPTIAH